MKLKIVIVLLLSFVVVSSQEIDSTYIKIQSVLDSTSNKATKLKLLLEHADFFFKTDPTKSKEYYLKANEIVNPDNLIDKAKTLSQLGIISRREGLFSEAYSYIYNSRELYKVLKDTFHISKANLNLGMVHRFLKEKDKEIEFYKTAYKLAQKIQDTLLIGEYYNSMGGVYRRSKKLDSALYNYKKALKIFEKLKLYNSVNLVNNNLSVVYGNQKKHDKAIQVKLKTLDFFKKANDKSALSLNYYNLAISYAKLSEYNIALQYIDSSTQIAVHEGYKLRIAKTYKLKGAIYAKKENFEKAYRSSILYKQHSDAIFDIQKQKKIKELELKNEFNIERKELELIAHKKDIQSKFYLILFSLIVFFLLLISFFAWKNYTARATIAKETLEKEKLKKEILAQKVKNSESELKSIIADNTMRLEFIKQLSKQIKADKSSSESKDVKNYTNTLLLKLQQQIGTESKLGILQDKINVINQGFDQKIMESFPSLTKTEREICSFLRLNLSIKEIASIRNSSTDSIKAARYRIRKKLNISKNQELEHFIQNLSL